jgi:peptide/nickel transport system substrate-binding protein
MKIRVSAALAAATAVGLAFTLSACSGTTAAPSGAAGGASRATILLLRAGLDFTLSSLDETKNIAADNVVGLSLETLVKFSPQGQVEPDLATSWSQTSPVTYVYHLRHGVKFWDGHPLTATDVAYSLNYDRAPGSDVAFGFTGVKSVTATDPYTVTVTLTQAEANWKYVPAEENAFIFEKAFQQAHAATFGQPGTLVMGSGPWVVDSLDPTKGAQVTAYPDWWGGKVPIQRIAFTFYSSETSEALAMRAGEIDFAPTVNSPKSFEATSGAKLLTTSSCDNAFFGMNVTQPGWDGSANTQPGGWNFSDYAPQAVDKLLASGLATSNPAQRFAAYSELFKQLQEDEPYVGLFVSDRITALSSKFAWPDFNPWWWDGAYALGITAAA